MHTHTVLYNTSFPLEIPIMTKLHSFNVRTSQDCRTNYISHVASLPVCFGWCWNTKVYYCICTCGRD